MKSLLIKIVFLLISCSIYAQLIAYNEIAGFESKFNNKINIRPVAATLSLTDDGSGIDRMVSIESTGQFRIVFEAADNWGIAQWYDLVNDPTATTNLAFSNFADVGVQEPGLFQMVWCGTVPEDPKLYMYSAKYFWPNAERSFDIIENTLERIIVETISHPLLAAGVATSLTVAVKYNIFPDGKIYLSTQMSTTEPQLIHEWRCAVLGLCDPTQTTTSPILDSQGWIRSSTTQNPYDWSGQVEKYLFAYWSKASVYPYTNWTKASIMMVSAPDNQYISRQNKHSWNWFKRWYYTYDQLPMNANDTIRQNYFIQLGTENSTILPNMINSTVADPIADAYIAILGTNKLDENKNTTIKNYLYQNYPNPFKNNTTIKYTIAQKGKVKLVIYDLLGKEIKTIVNENKPAGLFEAYWDGSDSNGKLVSKGMYLYKLTSGKLTNTKTLSIE